MQDHKEIKIIYEGKEYTGECTAFVVDHVCNVFEIKGLFNTAMTDRDYVDPNRRDKLCSVAVRF